MRAAAALLLLLAACSEPIPAPAPNDVEVSPPPPVSEPAEPQATAPASSPEAAMATADAYFALLNRGEYAQAWAQWPGAGSDVSQDAFAAGFERYTGYEARFGEPRTEGAAGTIYMTIPVEVTAPLKAGGVEALTGTITLRRVNDVPGSTAEQRSWRIHAVELSPRP